MEVEKLRILLIGSGGREHALAWKLSQSPLVESIRVVPGNGGTATCLPKVQNVSNVDPDDFASLLAFAKGHEVNLVVPGPEVPLVAGIESIFRAGESGHFAPISPVLTGSQVGFDALDLRKKLHAWKGVKPLQKISWPGIIFPQRDMRYSATMRRRGSTLTKCHTTL